MGAGCAAGLATGLIWDHWGARWALGLNALCAALAAGLLFWLAFAGPLRRYLVPAGAPTPVRVVPRPDE